MNAGRPGATVAVRKWARRFAPAAGLAVALAACGPSHPRGEAGVPGTAVEAVEPADSSGAGEASLFELTFPLTDQDGHTLHLSDLRGRPFVASMIYTRCTSVCPRITADLKNLERALGERDREHMRFVLISLDPDRDSTAALRAFAAEHALDPGRWTLLATGVEDMRTLAAVLGVRHRPDAGGEIAHTALIAVVDRAGVVRHRQAGIGTDIAPLVAAVRAVR